MGQGSSKLISRGMPLLLLVPMLVFLLMAYRTDVELLKMDVQSISRAGSNLETSTPNNSSPVSLFGTSPSPNETQQSQAETLPETRLELELSGTFTHTDSSQASALIAERGGKAKQVFIGEQVAEDALLVRVDKGYVTLRRNGQDEVLKLSIYGAPELSTANLFTLERGSVAPPAIPLNSPRQPEVQNTNTVSAESIPSAGEAETLRERLARLRSEERNN